MEPAVVLTGLTVDAAGGECPERGSSQQPPNVFLGPTGKI